MSTATTDLNNVNIFNCKHSNNLIGYYQNVRSLNNKLKYVMCNVPCNNYDFFILTETWLNADVLDFELGTYNYNIVRSDRSGLTNKCSRGGGVLIGVHNKWYLSGLITIPYNSVSVE